MNLRLLLLFSFTLLGALGASAQYTLKGTVYDSSRNYALSAVIVSSTAGNSVVTGAEGAYSLPVSDKDSVWFTFLGKPTLKYAVKTIPDLSQFDIALRVPATGSRYKVLKEVVVYGRNYRIDSARNRQEYARAFDFQRPNLGTMTSVGAGGAGIDVNELIRLFQFRKNKSSARFQARLLAEEEQKYIDNRFSKPLIRRLTGLTGPDLDAFQERFRPSVEFTRGASDYDFQTYIKLCYDAWMGKTPAPPEQQ
ncbi:hypothetical protein [Flaviaesturariibacter aridisoli]|uniref:Carboxypeptidase-like regulatory domain-containing protein n=1 Tax=Flaviaesturariibacter aridisoli TaxID=2545761 RepID=A0A4R4E244_9BACT|nr:hypothetical protein [Flaviaesturariibacter aridisoli]TCZ70443.1 hypothetical protein E0486_10835 [Flaviaesturariibacter aridisoli]